MTYLHSPGVAPVARWAIVLAVLANVIAAGAFVVALHHSDPRFPLVCGQSFIDGRTGHTIPMYVPCSERRPVRQP
jgi:hypothetical protein